jgi:hypothetical protein
MSRTTAATNMFFQPDISILLKLRRDRYRAKLIHGPRH